MKVLEDDDKMPWGKYKDERMEDVPAQYLHYLWINGKKNDKLCPVANYIKENMSFLQSEHPDGIWE